MHLALSMSLSEVALAWATLPNLLKVSHGHHHS